MISCSRGRCIMLTRRGELNNTPLFTSKATPGTVGMKTEHFYKGVFLVSDCGLAALPCFFVAAYCIFFCGFISQMQWECSSRPKVPYRMYEQLSRPFIHAIPELTILTEGSHGCIHLTSWLDHSIICVLHVMIGLLTCWWHTRLQPPFSPPPSRLYGPVGIWHLRKCLLKEAGRGIVGVGGLGRCTYPPGRWTDS